MGGGKSYLICRRAIELAETYPGVRGYLCRAEAVTFKRTTLMTMLDSDEGVGVLQRPGWKHHMSDQYFKHSGGSRIDYGGLASDEDRDKVKSMNLTYAEVDEASEVDQVSSRLIESRCGRQTKFMGIAHVIYASNPEPCWLETDFISTPTADRRFVPALASDNPTLPPGYIEHLKATYADMPELLDAYVNGSWAAIGSSDKVFPGELVLAAMSRISVPSGTVEWGVDVARMGDDKTTVWERRGDIARRLEKWAKQDTRTTSDKLVGLYGVADPKPTLIKVDDIGVGGGVVDNLVAAGLPVVGINVGAPAKENDKYANMRAELAWHLRVVLEGGGSLPEDEMLRSELMAMRYFFRSGRLVLEEKAEVKRRLGRSPDDADAVILAFAPARTSVFDYYRQ